MRNAMLAAAFVLLWMAATTLVVAAEPDARPIPAVNVAIVLRDQVPLRPAPRDSAKAHAILWQGEVIEVRGERLDYLQVYDHRRERAGFVRASELRRVTLTPEEAPELLAVMRFLRAQPGEEALGIGYAASYIQAAPAEALNSEAGIEALDILGTLAERLAQRASAGTAQSQGAQSALSNHLEVAARHGVKFVNHERASGTRICYDGDAFRRVLAMRSNAVQRARAALALTRLECESDARPTEARQRNEWRAQVMDLVESAGNAGANEAASALPGYLKNRVLLRRAALWSDLAYRHARQGVAAEPAANRALQAIEQIDKAELTDADTQTYRAAALRVNASRWAAVAKPTEGGKDLQIVTTPGQPGETCVYLVHAGKAGARDPAKTLAKRCTYAIVWEASARVNREGSALALAVQPNETWRELWVFRKQGKEWMIRVVPPAATTPEIGYAEFAGWVPGGAQMLIAREALGEGKYVRSFELLSLESFAPLRQASDPSILGAFRRWQDRDWKAQTLSVR